MSSKVITFDFWNTIFDSSGGSIRNDYRKKVLVNEIDKFGIVVKQEQFQKAMTSSWERFNKIWIEDQRTPSPRETAEFFWQQLDMPKNKESIEYLVKEFADAVLIYPPKLLPGVKEAIINLSENYTLGIVSDTGFSPGSILKEMLNREEILHYFSVFSFSDETGVAKPHPKAFNTILESLNCSPEYALHIGDIEKTDIIGAKNLNMKAIRYTGDPTALYNKDNPHKSLADFESNNWLEIPEIINSIKW